jgi:hypothetical protein
MLFLSVPLFLLHKHQTRHIRSKIKKGHQRQPQTHQTTTMIFFTDSAFSFFAGKRSTLSINFRKRNEKSNKNTLVIINENFIMLFKFRHFFHLKSILNFQFVCFINPLISPENHSSKHLKSKPQQRVCVG